MNKDEVLAYVAKTQAETVENFRRQAARLRMATEEFHVCLEAIEEAFAVQTKMLERML